MELQEKVQDRVAIIGINFEQPIGEASLEDTQTRLEAFQKLQPMNYPCLFGDFDPADRITDFQGFPTMLLVDKSGMVRLVMTGYHHFQFWKPPFVASWKTETEDYHVDRETSLELLNSTHNFPCQFTLKVIGASSDDFVDRCLNAIRLLQLESDDIPVTTRSTPNGKHTSITLLPLLTSAEQVLEAYEQLRTVGRRRDDDVGAA